MNSDRIYWQKKPDGSLSPVHVEKSSIGHHISTKAVGSDARVDITHFYKYPEGNKTNTSGPKPKAAFIESVIDMLHIDIVPYFHANSQSAINYAGN